MSGDEVQVYTASAIWKKTQLTRNKLIVAAVISGGDYDKVSTPYLFPTTIAEKIT